MSPVYGALSRLTTIPAPVVAPVRFVAPLPSPEAPIPRRRRETVCSSLTVNGRVWTAQDARMVMKGYGMPDELKNDKGDLRCSKRPGVGIRADYAIDICLSSWCLGCPFGSSND